jgi:hypothetical protein
MAVSGLQEVIFRKRDDDFTYYYSLGDASEG